MSSEHFDIVIIGSGAGGGTLAQRLAPTGKRILLLERGEWLPREKENWNSRAVFTEGRYKSGETWHDGISPAWPIRYEDLAPYYLEAERLYHVHGNRGEDPSEPPEASPFPWPGLVHEPRIRELFDDLRRIGRQPFALPIGLRLDESDRRSSACIKCDTCDGFPCLVDGKADAQVVCVEPALAFPNVEWRTGCVVERLETSASSREVTRMVYRRDGVEESVKGDIVVVSGGAINSAALLLRSASGAHPDGLANRSGVVGRHYMCHNNAAFVALSKRANPTRFQKTLGVNDFYFGDGDGGDWPYPLGHIQMLGKSDAEMFREDAPRLMPGMALDAMARHSIDFWLTGEDLPLPENRVTLDRAGGIRLSYTENNLEGFRRLEGKLRGMLSAIGCENHLMPCSVYLGKKIPIAGTAHQCGTVRFGTDPATSALDLHQFVADPGRPIPADSRSNDLWFQHVAIVVADMAKAYAALRRAGVEQVSPGPQRLPDWNPAAAGIEAFYFRDPEGHNLELIHFPPGKGEPRWQDAGGRLFLGIDHTALAVSDTGRAVDFYRDRL